MSDSIFCRIQPESRARAADDVFLHHDRAEIVRAILQCHLADIRPLRHPGTLHILEIIEEDPGQRLHPQIFRDTVAVLRLSARCARAGTSSR